MPTLSSTEPMPLVVYHCPTPPPPAHVFDSAYRQQAPPPRVTEAAAEQEPHVGPVQRNKTKEMTSKLELHAERWQALHVARNSCGFSL